MISCRSSGEKDLVVSSTASHSEASRAGMRWQLAPLDLARIFVIDLSHPAFVRHRVFIPPRRSFFRTVRDYDTFRPLLLRHGQKPASRETACPRSTYSILRRKLTLLTGPFFLVLRSDGCSGRESLR